MERITCFAEIAIQGDHALRFVNCTQDRVIYDVIGFEKFAMTLIDYRKAGLMAIQMLLQTGKLFEFAPTFNSPAQVSVEQDDNGAILIELDDIGDEQPAQMLWIAIGIEDSIPVYDYIFELIAPLADRTFAFLALFNIPAISGNQTSGLLECEYSN